jgi:hypothetical protein
MQEQQQGQVRDDPMQQQQHLPLYLPEWGQPSMDSHQDWQLIVSPSNMAPAEERRYHASTFSKVLQHLAPTGSPDNRTQPQPQQRDLVRVAEYMEALAADNTVLSCEVFHLQQLLVEQRRSASSSCEAVARKLASKAVKLSWELQQAELQLQLQQAASDVAQSDSSRHREDTDGVVVDEGGAAGEFVEGRRESSAAVRMASICDAVADKLKGMLAQHAARVKVGVLSDDVVCRRITLVQTQGAQGSCVFADLRQQACFNLSAWRQQATSCRGCCLLWVSTTGTLAHASFAYCSLIGCAWSNLLLPCMKHYVGQQRSLLLAVTSISHLSVRSSLLMLSGSVGAAGRGC